jgi:hypothetical protein
VWKPTPPLVQIESRTTARILAATIALALIAHAGAGFASCWASNPDGTRTCGEYINHGGGFEYLCEDQPGDCQDLGYTKVARAREQLPETRVEPRRPVESRSARTGEPERRKAGAEARTRDSEGAGVPDVRKGAPSGDRESRRNRSRLIHAAPGLEYQIAAWLSLTLAISGVLLLPAADRARFWRFIGGAAWMLSLVFLFMLAVFGGGSNRRRRRYY